MSYDPEGGASGFKEKDIMMMSAQARLGNAGKVLAQLGDPQLPPDLTGWRDGTGNTRWKDSAGLRQFLWKYGVHRPKPPLNTNKTGFRVVTVDGCRSLAPWSPERDPGYITVRHIDGSTALHILCEINDTGLIGDVLNFGANPNVQRRDGLYPVQIAARKGNALAVNHLLRFGSSFNIPFWQEYLALKNPGTLENLSLAKIESNDARYLYVACKAGDIKLVQRMMALGVSVNRQRADGYYPLHVAAEEGNCRMISLLIQHGANVHLTSRPSYHPLLAAVDMGHFEAARILLSAGAQPNIFPTGEIPAGARVLYFPEHPQGRLLLRGLIAAGANGRWADQKGFNLLHLVALHGSHSYICDLLPWKGLNPGTISTNRYTPIWCAARNGHALIVEQLLGLGVDRDLIPDDESGAAKEIAILRGCDDVVSIFQEFEDDEAQELLENMLVV